MEACRRAHQDWCAVCHCSHLPACEGARKVWMGNPAAIQCRLQPPPEGSRTDGRHQDPLALPPCPHTFATWMLSHGDIPIEHVSKMLGHNITQTQRYAKGAGAVRSMMISKVAETMAPTKRKMQRTKGARACAALPTNINNYKNKTTMKKVMMA